MFARTREEGERRLTRSSLELATTSLVAGFDVVFGVIALAAATAAMAPHFGPSAAHFFGSLAFGIAFIFIVVGRSELFTENFLVPLTAMRRGKLTKLKLAELWTISPILNIAGGTVLILIVSTQGVLPEGAPHAVNEAATHIDDLSLWSAFMSAIVGGALITAMTWMVEGVGTVGGRIVVAWVAGVILALASLNHVIVVTLELIFGMRYGADIAVGEVFANFGIAVAGNMIGGIVFVTLTRTSQAVGSGETDSPTQ
jgi:formate/nitrite transporter FocA (FNT family)